MVAVIPSLTGWATVIAVIGLVGAMVYILLGYWRGRRWCAALQSRRYH